MQEKFRKYPIEFSFVFILAFFFFVLYVSGYDLATRDDFLKDIVFSKYGSYAKLYPYSFFETIKFSPWIGYDLILGFLNSLIGERNTVYFALFFINLFPLLVLSYAIRKESKNVNIYIFFLLIFFYVFWGRVVLARPSIVVTMLMIIALYSESFLWVLISSFFYSLFWIYPPIVILVHLIRKKYKAAALNLMALFIGVAFWIIYGGADYFKYIWRLLQIEHYRFGIKVIENTKTIEFFLHNPIYVLYTVLVLVLLAGYFKNNNKKLEDVKISVLSTMIVSIIALFQIRYFTGLFLPVSSIFVMSFVNDKIKYSLRLKDIMPIFVFFIVIAVSLRVNSLTIEVQGNSRSISKIPAYSKVLIMPFGKVVFLLPYLHKGNISVLPSCEIGFNDKRFVKMYRESLRKKRIIDGLCVYLREKNITYIVSKYNLECKEGYKKIGNFNFRFDGIKEHYSIFILPKL